MNGPFIDGSAIERAVRERFPKLKDVRFSMPFKDACYVTGSREDGRSFSILCDKTMLGAWDTQFILNYVLSHLAHG